MKTATCFLGLLSVLVVGCGNSDAGEGGGGTSDTALQCSSVGWCTTWESDHQVVTDAPPLAGGTLTDGLYRTEKGYGFREAMLIQGKSILLIAGNWSNFVGTWKTEGEKLIVSVSGSCNDSYDEPMTTTFTYAFAVKGEELYTRELDRSNMPVVGWRKVRSLCEEDASFNCKASNCACITTTNKTLVGQPGCS
ncbi:hypothetical protein DRW03_36020 [Corallococcus sp. H22C18031201]|uniref:hypothetical protein n=1 Tax=Citreicoccus inhibens TaxID=2849499 RepID=UPI000E740801|nr:hypothetical protein [Citreicoccus inhibens]MBU8900340.1 hypothetical protein [Citreicoccus inhibens]RJS13579.1 hypothetical protein DRW03_36020 [Corallococcus sp. H22C18031201]